MPYPLSLNELMDDLRVEEMTFGLQGAMTESRTAGGDVIRHRIGARLWGGTMLLIPESHYDQISFEARLERLREPAASFLLYDLRTEGPASDPDGSTLSGATPQINSIGSDNQQISFSGLPSDYVLPAGTPFSFTYGSNPTRYAYHRTTESVTASGVGVTGLVSVTPYIRPGVSGGASVVFVRPILKAKVTEVDMGAARAVFTGGATVTWLQTLR